MTLDERIERHPGSHIVRVPRSQIAALKAERDRAIAERDLDRLAAEAWRRHCAEQRRRREADRLAKAIASNPEGRL